MTALEHHPPTEEHGSSSGGSPAPKREQSNVAIYALIAANIAMPTTKLIAEHLIELAECPLSMQLGPNEVLVGVTARFAPHSSANDVALAIHRFEDRLRRARPDVKYICVEPIPRNEPSPRPSH